MQVCVISLTRYINCLCKRYAVSGTEMPEFLPWLAKNCGFDPSMTAFSQVRTLCTKLQHHTHIHTHTHTHACTYTHGITPISFHRLRTYIEHVVQIESVGNIHLIIIIIIIIIIMFHALTSDKYWFKGWDRAG